MKKILLISLSALFILSSCSRDEVPYRAQANADVVYTYWTGPSGTIIEGDIYNDGETYLEAVEIRVKLYDLNGDLIDKDWFWINTYSYPGESTGFTLDLAEPYIYDVDVRITGLDQ